MTEARRCRCGGNRGYDTDSINSRPLARFQPAEQGHEPGGFITVQERNVGSRTTTVIAIEKQAGRTGQVIEKFVYIVANLGRQRVAHEAYPSHSGHSATGLFSVLYTMYFSSIACKASRRDSLLSSCASVANCQSAPLRPTANRPAMMSR